MGMSELLVDISGGAIEEMLSISKRDLLFSFDSDCPILLLVDIKGK
jgi:hypothetical protein